MEFDELRKATVLAVDDQRANLLVLEVALGKEFSVVFANSGPEAISLLEARRDIDVILMDVQMPIMDGFEAASRIKAMDGCQDIPIVFVTAVYNEDPFVKQGYKVGAVDYFSKPFDSEILRLKVAIYASFRQKSDVLKERARQLRESEALSKLGSKLSTVLGSLRVGVLVTDVRGSIVQANDEARSIRNDLAPARDDAGRILAWWDSGGTGSGLPGFLARTLASGETSHDSCSGMHGVDGEPKSILCTASPLRAPSGDIVGAALVIHDMTEPRKLETDLKTRIDRLASRQAAINSV